MVDRFAEALVAPPYSIYPMEDIGNAGQNGCFCCCFCSRSSKISHHPNTLGKWNEIKIKNSFLFVYQPLPLVQGEGSV